MKTELDKYFEYDPVADNWFYKDFTITKMPNCIDEVYITNGSNAAVYAYSYQTLKIKKNVRLA